MASALGGKTFILGIGAQKAGTSWLADYLQDRSEVFMAPLKELHYFDTKFMPDFRQRFDVLFKRKRSTLRRQLLWPSKTRWERLEHVNARIAMTSDRDYIDYFERFVPEQCTHFGEITPSYSMLSSSAFENMAGCFERSKVIFILRDPVDRFYSHLRMNIRSGRLKGSDEELFVNALDDRLYVKRTQYHETLAAVRAVFPAEDILVSFYEDMFCDEEIARICNFLSLSFVPGAYGDKSNAAPKPAKLDPELAALARERFAPVYDYCRAEFGERVPASWRA